MRAPLNDLFTIFPDLPWSARPSRATRAAVDAGVEQWRQRAFRNIGRQKAAAAAVRERIRQVKPKQGAGKRRA